MIMASADHERVFGWSEMVPLAGFEPALPPPEGGALSPELQGRKIAPVAPLDNLKNLSRTDHEHPKRISV